MKKNRIYIMAFLLTFVLSFAFMTIKSYANTTNATVQQYVNQTGRTYSLLHDYSTFSNLFILKTLNGDIMVCYSTYKPTIQYNNTYNYFEAHATSINYDLYYKTTDLANPAVMDGGFGFSNMTMFSRDTVEFKSQILMSTYNITADDNTTVFFSVPIVKVPILGQEVNQTALGGTLSQVTGLLPLLLLLVVGFLGLRKALAALFQILHKA